MEQLAQFVSKSFDDNANPDRKCRDTSATTITLSVAHLLGPSIDEEESHRRFFAIFRNFILFLRSCILLLDLLVHTQF